MVVEWLRKFWRAIALNRVQRIEHYVEDAINQAGLADKDKERAEAIRAEIRVLKNETRLYSVIRNIAIFILYAGFATSIFTGFIKPNVLISFIKNTSRVLLGFFGTTVLLALVAIANNLINIRVTDATVRAGRLLGMIDAPIKRPKK